MANIVKFPLDQLELQDLELTNDEKDRIVLTLQGKALKNPVQPIITTLRNEINRQRTMFQNSIGQSDFVDLTDQQLQNLVTKFTQLDNAIVKYQTHSNILSGVTLNYNGFPPSFLGRLSIAQSYNRIKETLRKKQDGPCGVEESKSEIFSEIFYSILGYAQTEMEDLLRIINDLHATWIEAGTNDYNTVFNRLTLGVTTINNFKTIDNRGFYKAYNFVVKVSTAQGLINSKNDDFSKKLFDSVNGTPLFNTEDIEALKIQCQVWGNDTTPPPDDFSDKFQEEFALTSIADLVDINIGASSDYYMLQFISGALTSLSIASLGICLDDLCNVSGAASGAVGQALVLGADGYYSPGNVSGGSGGSSTFTSLTDTPASIQANQFVVGDFKATGLEFTTIGESDLPSTILRETGSHYITGTYQFDTTSDKFSLNNGLSGRHSVISESTTGKEYRIPDLDGYAVVAITSGLGCSEGMAFFVSADSRAEHRFITSGDVQGLATVATSGDYNDLSNLPSLNFVTSGDIAQFITNGLQAGDNVSQLVNDAGYITSSVLVSYAPILTAYKTANESKTSDTTFADDTDLVIPLAANKIYELHVFIITNSDAATDLKWRINGPKGALAKFNSTAGNAIGFSGFGTTNNVAGAGADRIGIYHGQVTTDATAGDLQFQWAQQTSGVAASTLKQGSYIRLMEIATTA